VDLVERIARREGVGDLIAERFPAHGRALGCGSEHFAMHG